MKKNASLFLVIMLVFSLLVTGCGTQSATTEVKDDKSVKPLKVALILPGKVDDV